MSSSHGVPLGVNCAFHSISSSIALCTDAATFAASASASALARSSASSRALAARALARASATSFASLAASSSAAAALASAARAASSAAASTAAAAVSSSSSTRAAAAARLSSSRSPVSVQIVSSPFVPATAVTAAGLAFDSSLFTNGEASSLNSAVGTESAVRFPSGGDSFAKPEPEPLTRSGESHEMPPRADRISSAPSDASAAGESSSRRASIDAFAHVVPAGLLVAPSSSSSSSSSVSDSTSR